MTKTITKKDRLSIDVMPEQHRQIKILASHQGKSIRQYILESLAERIKKDIKNDHTPNLETAKILKDNQSRKSTTTYKNIDEMFADLGI